MTATRVNIDHLPGCRQSSGLRRHGNLLTCRACGVSAPIPSGDLEQDREPTLPPPRARYALACLDCDRVMWIDNPKPRVPLCSPCKRRRAKRQPSKPSTTPGDYVDRALARPTRRSTTP